MTNDKSSVLNHLIDKILHKKSQQMKPKNIIAFKAAMLTITQSMLSSVLVIQHYSRSVNASKITMFSNLLSVQPFE